MIGGIVLVALVIALSWIERETSSAWLKNEHEVIEKAARMGDHKLARALLDKRERANSNQDILGVDAELEELVYPDRVIKREIARYEELSSTYPGHRDILLMLSRLYGELGQADWQAYYFEAARKIDPNNPIFQP